MNVSKEKKAIVAGMVGCLLYVIGDFLFAAIGKNQSADSIGLMVKVAYLDMATWRMVLSIICGVLGTALYYIGFHQIQDCQAVYGSDDGLSPRRLGCVFSGL